MVFTLPLPVRVAAGLLATGIDRLRRLPEDLPALPVTVAGQALRTSLRLRQELAQLAGRGDELLSGLTSRPQQRPQWARFDEEEDPADDESDQDGAGAPSGPAPAARQDNAPSGPARRSAPTGRRHPHSAFDAAADLDDDGANRGRTSDTPPEPMPGYHQMSLAQVRGRLRKLSRESVAQLLEFEQDGAGRAPFLTLLSNRLTTVDQVGH